MMSPSKINLNQSEDDQPHNSHCMESGSSDTSEVNGNSGTKCDGLIYLDYSMEIIDPKNTPLKWYPNKNDIKVLIIPENGCQVLVVFETHKNGSTVQDIITPLANLFKDKIIHILLVEDPIHKVRYAIKVFLDPNINGNINNDSSTRPAVHKATKLSHSHDASSTNGSESESVTSTQESMYLKRSLRVLTIYPSPPHKGSEITLDDLQCLDKNQHLNDTIINFYLMYLVLETVFLEDQERIHLYESFFYTRLINSQLTSINGSDVSAHPESAEIQHERVKRWTKHVNIFEKDFVIIPINENKHWFLVIICYPNMISVQSDHSTRELKGQSPRILIFESIHELKSRRLNVAQTLKNYVRCEYKAKFGTDSVLLENDLDVVYPDVPKQRNTSDCGLYLLQYAENFLKDYVGGQKFSLPLKSLKNWFDVDVIQEKRDQLKRLIIRLASDSQVFKKRRRF